MRVAIVCTGSSLDGHIPLSFPNSVFTIAVNGGYVIAPDYHAWFTLDPSYDNIYRARKVRRPIMAVPNGVLPTELFDMRDQIETRHRVAGHEFGKYRVKFGMSQDPGEIHTGNSATGAMQLAAHVGATKIAVFGMDGTKDYAKPFNGYALNLDMLPALCDHLAPELAARGVEVYNGSFDSRVTTWPRVTVTEAKQWISKK